MCKTKELNQSIKAAANERWKKIAKPIGSLGIFEDTISQIAAVQGTLNVDISKRCALVVCSDNGVTAEGVTQTDSSVTAVVSENIARGKASVCLAADVAKAEVIAVDVGVERDTVGTLNRKISYGTKNIAREAAMTRTECEKAIQTGIELAKQYTNQGYKIIVIGEMGIGNTTTSAAVTSVLLDKPPSAVTGRGAGLDDERLEKKINVIQRAIELHKPEKNDIIDVISKVGGHDIAVMAGIYLGCALCGTVSVIDGYISSVAAMCAKKLCPASGDFMIASHCSSAPSSAEILKYLGKKAVITAEMFPGEGVGGVMLLPLLDACIKIFKDMPTFHEVNIEEYEEFK